MSDEGKHKELLTAVFAEAAPEDFRSALLAKTLQRMHQQRRQKQILRAAVLIVLGAFAVFTWQYRPEPVTGLTIKPALARHLNYHLVSTRPLPVSAVVETRPLALAQIVESAPIRNIIKTQPGNFRMLNDEELLALISHRPAALIRLDGTSEYLVFANPADENGFAVP